MLEQSLAPSGNPVGPALLPGKVSTILWRVLASCYSLESLLLKTGSR